MGMLRFFVILFFIASISCKQHQRTGQPNFDTTAINENKSSTNEHAYKEGNGALLLTRFKSLEEFKSLVQIHYAEELASAAGTKPGLPQVCLTYSCNTGTVTSILKSGISQTDFVHARNGNIWDKMMLGLKCPYALMNKKDLARIENLGRRRPWEFGKGDVAFYDLAEITVSHISDEDTINMSTEDLSEKGYLNTFNHITAQAFMTSIFSEKIADFVADVHELYNMPELISGKFTEAQLADFVDGPVDNYIDMLNNEWGQELGKVLRNKYSINRSTHWTAELMANYLNDIQSYYSWTFQIGFKPFRSTDEKVIRFARKINTLLKV